jgi:hypothetical protein
MVRAIRKASERVGLTPDEIEGLFWHNAVRLVDSVKGTVK